MTIIRLFLFALVVGGCALGEGRRLEVLFLGDEGHHKPIERYRLAAQALGPRGYNLTYVEDMRVLNPEDLAKYDALMIYANINTIAADQEKAMLDYVANGGGLVPVHCASFCFRNSQAYVDLVGAQFKRHGAGIFTAMTAKRDHPIMDGFEDFETWDETYVHAKHNNKDRVVLQFRNEATQKEPWTWVRTHGKGRVFYTAYGHDERTWSKAGFQDLLARGILWAVGTEAAAAHAKLRTPQFRYEDRPTVQNYEKRTPKPKYQFPVSAADSRKHTQWEAGFDYQLFASEPDIVNPIWIAWDERGRCWIAETVDYPNTVNDDRTGRDRIRILEDTDGDGKADTFKVFAEGINIPTSFAFHNGGVIVAAAPHFYFLKDTDGDDMADEKKVISSGWGVGDTHAGPSNVQYGFDNWFYGAVGYSGYRNGESSFRSGIYRFKPDFSKVEFISQFNNNTWGLGFSEGFDLFGSTANNNHAVYVGIPKRYYDLVPEMAAPRGKKIEAQGKAFPITDKYRQVDVFGGFTAAAGFQLYTAREFPQSYWNRAAFVTEPTMHLTAKCIIEKDGAGFREVNGFNLTASVDEWYSPVHAQVGPDGAVWILDWYNFIIQHNPTPKLTHGGFKGVNGKGNAHENPLRDKQHGRIWRVVPKNKTLKADFDLSGREPKDLVAALKSDNLFWRLTAQRLLIERGNTDVVPALVELVQDPSVDAVGINGGAVHALYALRSLGGLEGEALAAAKAALRHPSPAVRKAALAVLPRTSASAVAIVDSKVLADGDLNVRKDAFLAAAEFSPHPQLGMALAAAGTDSVNGKDEWLRDALAIAAYRQGLEFLRGFAKHGQAPTAKASPQSAQNLFANGTLESADGKLPQGWTVFNYSGKASHRAVKEGRDGGWCVEITSESGADTSLRQTVQVEPGASYRLSCWVKTDGLVKTPGRPGKGVMMNGHGSPVLTKSLVNTKGKWRQTSTTFVAKQRSYGMNLLFGGWGHSTGRALYDDVELVKIKAGVTGENLLELAAKRIVQNGDRKAIAKLSAELPSAEQAKIVTLLTQSSTDVVKPDLNGEQLIAAGKKIFSEICFSCHGLKGEGTVGPNLTDMHFIHGATRAEQDKIIRKGVIEKGMLPWEQTLNPQQLKAVSEFVWSLRGTNAPNGKAPEGLHAKQ